MGHRPHRTRARGDDRLAHRGGGAGRALRADRGEDPRVSRFVVRLVVALGALRGLRKRRRERKTPERIVAPGQATPRAELAVVVLLLACALCAVGFIAVYAIDGIPSKTQYLGLTLGGALICL